MYAGGTTMDEVKDAPNGITTVLLQPAQLEKTKFVENTWNTTSEAQHPDGCRMDRRVPDEGLGSHRQADPES
jgi:hypothetical protein